MEIATIFERFFQDNGRDLANWINNEESETKRFQVIFKEYSNNPLSGEFPGTLEGLEKVISVVCIELNRKDFIHLDGNSE